ncbi:hypothetical protein AST99_03190 [Formosa algae]|uniref:hypothetical protein n=1 Tax=Formosa algae TaxID=225843 RepID=UPI00071046B4|nr:hypothetical protein [Formosa algae]OEI81596.1 hypothetical protein AST99_03190 [Formosa algae]
MQEFLRNYYWILSLMVEAVAAITALVCYKKYKNTTAKYFIYFLLYIFICETISLYPYLIKNGVLGFLDDTVLRRNFWWSTLFWCVGSPLFYMFFYLKLIRSTKIKSFIKILAVVFIVFSLLTIALNLDEFFSSFTNSILIFGEFIILFLASVYFYEMLQSEDIINFYKCSLFFISATVFMWLLITTPLIFYDIYFTLSDWNFIILKWQIFLLANIFMYLTFSFSLLWCNPENR